jgi:hypothetical protein
MLKLTSTIALSAALSAAVLLGGATPTTAGTPTCTDTSILTGGGSWETPIGTVGFNVSVIERIDGSFRGSGMSYLHNESGISWFHFKVTGCTFVGDEILVVGRITRTFNVPPRIAVGSLTALLVQDNGSGGAVPDMVLSASGLPPFLTIDQIAAGLPPFRFPLATGNFRIY